MHGYWHNHVQHDGREAARREGLSAVAETCSSTFLYTDKKWLDELTLVERTFRRRRHSSRVWVCDTLLSRCPAPPSAQQWQSHAPSADSAPAPPRPCSAMRAASEPCHVTRQSLTLTFDSLAVRAVGNGMSDCLRAGIPPRCVYQPPRPTQPPTLCGTRNEHRPRWCAAAGG